MDGEPPVAVTEIKAQSYTLEEAESAPEARTISFDMLYGVKLLEKTAKRTSKAFEEFGKSAKNAVEVVKKRLVEEALKVYDEKVWRAIMEQHAEDNLFRKGILGEFPGPNNNFTTGGEEIHLDSDFRDKQYKHDRGFFWSKADGEHLLDP